MTETPSARTALIAGASAAAATTVTIGLAGLGENGSPWPALNAVSKMVHGNHAPWRDEPSWKFTGTGTLLNTASVLSWAVVYAVLRGRRRDQDVVKAVTAGAATAALAYVIDYHIVPERFTPGFERRLSGRSLGLIYGALALGLAASELTAPDGGEAEEVTAPRLEPARVLRLDSLRRTMGVRDIR